MSTPNIPKVEQSGNNRQPLGEWRPAQQPGDVPPTLKPAQPYGGILPPGLVDLTPDIDEPHLRQIHKPGTLIVEQATLRHAEAPEPPASLE